MQETKASQTDIIMSPRKIRRIMNEIRGKKVTEAYNMLRMMPYRAAKVVLKNLIDASHNAQVQFGAMPESLVVSQAMADGGKVFRRFKPRAQGRIYKRLKRTAHLTIHVKVLEKAVKK